jgi:signal transduction histidine kinase
MADPLSIRRVLENLTDNAVDSLESREGVVRIETACVADGGLARVRIIVSDTGAGMTDDEMKKIFDDFYTTKPHGTGLGLSVVRRLVMDHGGSIRVESEKGKGSRFIVELPAEEAT